LLPGLFHDLNRGIRLDAIKNKAFDTGRIQPLDYPGRNTKRHQIGITYDKGPFSL
jgi:hypothetical protein